MRRLNTSLIISQHYLTPQIGGISSMMEALARGLSGGVACVTAARAEEPTELDRRVRVVRRPAAFSSSTLIQAMVFGWTFAEIASRARVSFAHLATVGEGYIGLQLKQRLGIPFLLYAHGSEIAALPRSATGWRAPLDALHAAHRVVAVSQETAARVRALGVVHDSVRVVYPGCDIELFRPIERDPSFRLRVLGARSDAQVMLTVGNLVERKGHDTVIRAIPYIRKVQPNVVYVVVGIGAQRAVLEKLAAEVGVREHVIFVGAVERDELPSYYAMSDVFVMASRTREEATDLEGFGLVYLEAAACGRAVVAGREGGAPEAVVDGETGILTDPRDPEDVGRALSTLLSNCEIRERMAEQALRRVLNEFQWSRFCRDIENLMAEPAVPIQRRTAAGVA